MTGGYTPSAPPPIPQKRKDVGWVWALVGCGGILVLLVIGVTVALTSSGGKKGGFGKIVSNATTAVGDGELLIPVRDSLKRYRTEHKEKYPAHLKELVPKYLTEAALDDLNSSKIEYTPPAQNAPAETPVLSIATEHSEILGQNHFYITRILKNDEVVLDQVVRTNIEKQKSSSSRSLWGGDEN